MLMNAYLVWYEPQHYLGLICYVLINMFFHSSASGKYTASVRDARWSSTLSGIELLLNTCTQLKCSWSSHIVFYFWDQLAFSIIWNVSYAQIVILNFWILAVCTLNSAHHSLDDCVSSSGKGCIISFGRRLAQTPTLIPTSFAIQGSMIHQHSLVLSFDDTWQHLHFMIELHAIIIAMKENEIGIDLEDDEYFQIDFSEGCNSFQ